MTGPDAAHLAAQHTLGDATIPEVVIELAADGPLELAWHNELGGLTFRIGDSGGSPGSGPSTGDRFVKWNPRSTGVDLARERVRLDWLHPRHPIPRVLAYGEDDEAQWLVTAALTGEAAVGDRWRARRGEAITAIATGLRAIHALPIDEVPPAWPNEVWVGRAPEALGPRPPIDEPVLVHGDACAPNTLIADDGAWVGHVDLGDLGVGDRWADLAIASLSLDWNFGEGHQPELYEAYGIEPDIERIDYYRALWHAES